MDAFPAYVPLAGRTVVIAGGGDAAEAKARLFAGSPANVLRVQGPAAFQAEIYRGAALAFVASDDDSFIMAAVAAARAAHVPVNVTDRPELCDFTTPAVIDRGEVVAAVGTGGASPRLATLLRAEIEARIPLGAGRVAALFRRHQAAVRAALPDLHRRRAFLRSVLQGDAADAAMAGDMELASRSLLEALATDRRAEGIIQFVSGHGPADLLTLRASRALAAADLLAADADADAGVLALARRDARRLNAIDATPDQLITLARDGQRVARVATTLQASELETLRASGVAVEVLASIQV